MGYGRCGKSSLYILYNNREYFIFLGKSRGLLGCLGILPSGQMVPK